MQYVIIALSGFALTTPLMWWVLRRRFRRRTALRGRTHVRGRPVRSHRSVASAGRLVAYSSSSGGGCRGLVLAAVVAAVAGVAVGLGTFAKQEQSSPPPAGGVSPTAPEPSAPEPSATDGLQTGGGGTGGGDSDTADTGGGSTADDEGVLPLLSADNLGALGSFLGGVAAAAAVCVSVYQLRLNRSASALAAPASQPPPAEPPPSEGYL